MTPLKLTLEGFCGIRDGMRRNTLTIDFDQPRFDGLIAITGPNGQGKTTVLDNMTPYPVMPSHASGKLSGFTYYEHVYLPTSRKELIWSHNGIRYRTELIIRPGVRPRTEAYLLREVAGQWRPVASPDGQTSDGKMATYQACLEGVLGSAQTYFTSAFAAQNRRQLSAYDNGEIKTLLTDLLDQDELRTLGKQANEVTKLLRSGLDLLRREHAGIAEELEKARRSEQSLAAAPLRASTAQAMRTRLQAAVTEAHDELAVQRARKAADAGHAQTRAAVQREMVAIAAESDRAEGDFTRRERREMDRDAALSRRLDERLTLRARRITALRDQLGRHQALLRQAGGIERAARHLPRMKRVHDARVDIEEKLIRQYQEYLALEADCRLERQRLAGIEQQAGAATLRHVDLTRRFGLAAQVPCSGMELQARCQLLGDANEAKALLPAEATQISRLAVERAQLLRTIATMEHGLQIGTVLAANREIATTKCARTASRLGALEHRAVLLATLRDAERAASSVAAELDEVERGAARESPTESAERAEIAQALHALDRQRAGLRDEMVQRRERALAALAALPQAYVDIDLDVAAGSLAHATAAMEANEAAYMDAVRDQLRREEVKTQAAVLEHRLALQDAHLAQVEQSLSNWSLTALCLGNDGAIALLIDDAGPALASLANDLLLACYGPRFTLAIMTQVDTAKGAAKEGFKIMVHDAQTTQTKNVTLMSGGERVWINECLTRAIAIYLAQQGGASHETLFTDESDGPFDPERKRMFMAMKRQVLLIGGYRREYFISHSPELTTMADASIDITQYVGGN